MRYMAYYCKGSALEMGLETMEAMGTEACAATGFAAPESWNDAQDEVQDAGQDGGLGMGLAFEAHLNPMELAMARRFVAELEIRDPQEEMHAWHLAASHLLAAQRIGKSRQEGLSQRAEQIEVGLAVRLMTLADRKSTSLDRHRAFKLKTADEAALQAASQAFQEAEAAKRAAAAAEEAERAAWRRRCREARPREEEAAREARDGQEERARPEALEAREGLQAQEGLEALGEQEELRAFEESAAFEEPAAAGNGRDAEPAVPRLSEAEAAAQLAWEQAIEASRPGRGEEEAEEEETAGASIAPGGGRDP